MTLSLTDGSVVQTLSSEIEATQVAGKHDHASTNKINFAEWCDCQIEGRHIIKIDYDTHTETYWADIVS